MSTLNQLIDDLYEARYQSNIENRFWAFVDQVDWNKDRDPDRIKKMLMKEADPDTLEELEAFNDQAYAELDKVMDHVIHTVSADSYHYFLTHIIGSGKELYDEVLNDPEVGLAIFDSHQYEEGFGYIWPDEWDYQRINPQYYLNQARELLPELETAYKNISNPAAKKYVKDLARRMRLAQQAKWEEAVKGLNLKDITSDWGTILRDCGKPCYDFHYAVSNFFLDIESWMLNY